MPDVDVASGSKGPSSSGGFKVPFPSVKIKSRKRKGQSRAKSTVDSLNPEEDIDHSAREAKEFGCSKIEHLKILAKKRKRVGGIDGKGLSKRQEKKIVEENEEKYKEQAWKNKGGLMSSDKALMFLDGDGDVNMRHLNATFAKESKRTDNERAMKDFIDREVARRKGYLEDYERRKEEADVATLRALEDRKLYLLDDQFENIPRTYAPSNQGEIGYAILEGIPEVNLGTDTKIKNIEDTIKTQEKLAKLGEEDRNKVISVPSNFTANYLLHNRYQGEGFEDSDTNRYIDVKTDMSEYSEARYDVCNDNSTR